MNSKHSPFTVPERKVKDVSREDGLPAVIVQNTDWGEKTEDSFGIFLSNSIILQNTSKMFELQCKL